MLISGLCISDERDDCLLPWGVVRQEMMGFDYKRNLNARTRTSYSKKRRQQTKHKSDQNVSQPSSLSSAIRLPQAIFSRAILCARLYVPFAVSPQTLQQPGKRKTAIQHQTWHDIFHPGLVVFYRIRPWWELSPTIRIAGSARFVG